MTTIKSISVDNGRPEPDIVCGSDHLSLCRPGLGPPLSLVPVSYPCVTLVSGMKYDEPPMCCSDCWRIHVRAWRKHGVELRPTLGGYLFFHRPRWGAGSPIVFIPVVPRIGWFAQKFVYLTVEKLMERPVRASSLGRPVGRLSDPKFMATFPTLAEFLFTEVYSDGSPRKLSSWLCFVKEGRWTGMLKDPDGERCLWVSAETYDDLHAAIDLALSDPNAVWRADRNAPKKVAKRL